MPIRRASVRDTTAARPWLPFGHGYTGTPDRHGTACGTLSLLAGFVVSLLSMPSSREPLKPQILAAFLALTGLGLRIESAIGDRKS
ncbi:hypothetical protein ACFW0V_03190 [Micromonospora parva]|uniref:hypothetical protein n=1 Tax=Micromonospora parva TaxID=1464048 RepID=UPI00366B1B1D